MKLHFFWRALKKSIHTKIFSMNQFLIYNFIQEAQVITMKFRDFYVFQQPPFFVGSSRMGGSANRTPFTFQYNSNF